MDDLNGKLDVLECFAALIKTTSKYIKINRPYDPEIRQCSVVAIFKFSTEFLLNNPHFAESLKNILKRESETQILDLLLIIADHEKDQTNSSSRKILEILYTQRIVNIKDRHSGQVCFPGGKLDENESDFQGGIREVEEEIGLKITPNNSIYLGKLPRNYLGYEKDNFKYFISHNFILNLENLDFLQNFENCPLNEKNLKLCKTEIEKAFWIDYRFILENFTEKKVVKIIQPFLNFQLMNFAVLDFYKANIPDRILEKISRLKFNFKFYILNFENGHKTWGVTLLLTGCISELSIYEGIDFIKEKEILNFSEKSRRYVVKSEDSEVDHVLNYGMRCKEELFRMRRYVGGDLRNMKL